MWGNRVWSGRSRRLLLIGGAVAAALAALAIAASGLASAAGGTRPGNAPLVQVGKQYFGTTHKGDGETQIEYWRLPPLQAQDLVTIAWHDRDLTGATRLCLAQDIDDFTVGAHECSETNSYYAYFDNESYGSARTSLEIPNTSSQSFLKFYKRGYTCCGDGGPYDFVIETIQHQIGASLSPVTVAPLSGVMVGYANLTSGVPVPDGLVFNLVARWKDGSPNVNVLRFPATSVGGALGFNLALPPTAEGRKVNFLITRPADLQYREVRSVALRVPVVGAPAVDRSALRSCLAKARRTAQRKIRAARHRRGQGKARALRAARNGKKRAVRRCHRQFGG